VARLERDILEFAIQAIAEQAVKADELVDQATSAGGPDHPVAIQAKMLRLELISIKADVERQLGPWSLNCRACSRDVHWVLGLGTRAGHWAHGEPAPLGAPVV
jgi:hypothetical protein